MIDKVATKTDTKGVIATARQAMQDIKNEVSNEEYSDTFKEKVLKDLEEVEELAKRIKRRCQK